MPDMQKLQNNKNRIMSIIQSSGPSFPGRIARETGISPLFVSAFLSELVSEKRLKLSNMKVGSSPLYFLPGQEKDLEKFTDHLNQKEKEAFHSLKDAQVLKDEDLEPAIRVALRKIKDFASPVNVRSGEEIKIFWRYFLLSENETRDRIQSLLLNKQQKEEVKEIELPEKIKAKELSKEIKELPVKKVEEIKTIDKPEINTEIAKNKPVQSTEFSESIKDYLLAKDIEVLQEISAKKKEFISKIRTDELFGKQEYFLISKDKKKINTDDLTIALQKAQSEKMPALVISPGEPDKKAKEYLKEWRNLIKFEQVKI